MNSKDNPEPGSVQRMLGALAVLSGLGREPVGSWVKTNPTLRYTKNLFGPQDEISGKLLRLVERNSRGDCCCVFDGKSGTNLVDVDYRDITPNSGANPTGGVK